MKRILKCKSAIIMQALCLIASATIGTHEIALASTSAADASSLAEAINNAGTSAVEIVATNNITIDSSFGTAITVGAGKNITLDLNGNNIVFTSFTNLSVVSGTLTIKNGTVTASEGNVALSAESGASLYLENVTATSNSSALIYIDSSEVYLNGASLTRTGDTGAVIEFGAGENAVYGSDGNKISEIGSNVTSAYNADFAQNNQNQEASNGTPITVTVEDAYSVIIPESIDFGKLTYTGEESSRYAEKTGSVTAEYVITDGTTKLNVTVYGDGTNGEFILTNGNETLEYAVQNANGDAIEPNGSLTEFSAAGSVDISVVVDRRSLTKSGVYSGFVNFVFELK